MEAVYLSSYLSDYFDTIKKINQHYRDNKPISNLDYLFHKADFLNAASNDTKHLLYNIYSDIDNIDDECIMDGMPHGKLVRHDTQVYFICDDNGVDTVVYGLDIPQSIIDLTFSDRHGKIQKEVTVVAFIQRVNTLLARDTEYQKNRKGYLNEQYGKECIQHSPDETDEVQCGSLH